MSKLALLILMAASTLVACQKSLLVSRARSHAPRAPEETGLIVSHAAAGEIENVLAHNPAARVRVLSRRHGLYELFGVRAQDIRAQTDARVEPNRFIAAPAGQAVPAPADFQIGNLKPCVATTSPPQATLTTDGAFAPTMELGGQTSFAVARPSPEFNYAFQIVRQDSLEEAKDFVVDGPAAAVELDTLGLHKVFLVTQDSQNQCGIVALQFLVSANPPLLPSPPDTSAFDREWHAIADQFTHLDLVSARPSWAVSQGQDILVAVIDTGVNYNHPGLRGRIAKLGRDFINGDEFPFDDNGHGSHVAGLIAARGFGMAQKARLLPVKAMTSLGSDLATIAAAILYSVDEGAAIINLSLGASVDQPSVALTEAADYAEKRGVLLVVAAGNGDPASGFGFDIDGHPVFPASLPNENIVAVGAFDSINLLALYSNFGARSVDVLAPGGWDGIEPVISTALQNPAGRLFSGLSGTSQAAPVVAGIAAQVWSLHPQAAPRQVKAALLRAGTADPELHNLCVSGRHIDALAALLDPGLEASEVYDSFPADFPSIMGK